MASSRISGSEREGLLRLHMGTEEGRQRLRAAMHRPARDMVGRAEVADLPPESYFEAMEALEEMVGLAFEIESLGTRFSCSEFWTYDESDVELSCQSAEEFAAAVDRAAKQLEGRIRAAGASDLFSVWKVMRA